MKDRILDYFDDFDDLYDQNAKIVAVKYFYFESEARLYAARLKQEGIKCFVSNTNTITVIPLGEGGIGLHVKERDLETAMAIVNEMDKNKVTVREEDFREADLEDIEFQKNVRAEERGHWEYIVLVLLLILILLISFFL